MLIEAIAKELQGRRLGANLLLDAFFVFVCGRDEKESASVRKRFLDYAKNRLPEFDFFVAERVVHDELLKTSNLLSFESRLTNFSDCVIIFLESPGTLAELGAFAGDDAIARQTLVVNDSQYKNQKSFINDGPLKKLGNESEFGKAIFVPFNSILLAGEEISRRLRLKRRKSPAAVGVTFGSYFTLGGKDRLLLLVEIVRLLQPVTYGELVTFLKVSGGKTSVDLSTELRLGLTVDLIKRVSKQQGTDAFYFVGARWANRFVLNKRHPLSKLRARVVSIYAKKDKKRFEFLLGEQA